MGDLEAIRDTARLLSILKWRFPFLNNRPLSGLTGPERGFVAAGNRTQYPFGLHP